MSVKSMFNNTMDIYSVAITKDNIKGDVETRTEEQTGIGCRKRNMNGQERELLGRLGIIATQVIYCAYIDITVSLDESFVIKFGSQYYDIQYVDNVNEANKYFKIYIEERK